MAAWMVRRSSGHRLPYLSLPKLCRNRTLLSRLRTSRLSVICSCSIWARVSIAGWIESLFFRWYKSTIDRLVSCVVVTRAVSCSRSRPHADIDVLCTSPKPEPSLTASTPRCPVSFTIYGASCRVMTGNGSRWKMEGWRSLPEEVIR